MNMRLCPQAQDHKQLLNRATDAGATGLVRTCKPINAAFRLYKPRHCHYPFGKNLNLINENKAIYFSVFRYFKNN